MVLLTPARTVGSGLQLTEEQRAATRCDASAYRVLGAPGTGISTVVVETVVARVRAGWAPDEVLVLAPTRTAAARLRDRVASRLAATHTEPLARTPSSFAFGLLRRSAALRGDVAPRLLTGPEQDVVLRELLAGHAADGSGPLWPTELEAARQTRGFRHELRDLLMRAVELGVSPQELARRGLQQNRPEWVAAAQVMAEYDDVTALSRPGVYDPAWILVAAADLLEDDPEARQHAVRQLRLVLVDEAHELTPAAARLLSVLASGGVRVGLLGDPDAAVHTFRGADPRVVGTSWSEWVGSGPTLLLSRSFTRPAAVAPVAAAVVGHIGILGGTDRRFCHSSAEPGSVTVDIFRAVSQEAAHVAAVLRRAHLVDAVPWSDMSVIVRGQARLAAIRRALTAAAVPADTDSSAVGLVGEPATRPLVVALDVVSQWARCPDDVAPLDPAVAIDLLCSPLGGYDPVGLRRLRRRLRDDELSTGGARASDELLADLLRRPVYAEFLGQHEPQVRSAARLARALAAGVTAAQTPEATAETVLWALWVGVDLAGSWQRTALAGGAAGHRADRDLDAVVALFDAAARFVDRLPAAGIAGFLEHLVGQDVAPDTLAARGGPQDSVALLTPAAAAGRHWRVVVVAGVQEGVWPDLRVRGSLLGAPELVASVTGRGMSRRAAAATVRHDEARLFHVAVTRTTDRLHVTATRNDDEQPSVFVELVRQSLGRRGDDDAFTEPDPLMSLAGLVAGTRRSLAQRPEPGSVSAAVLSYLAGHGVRGADPAQWWCRRPLSDDRPRRADDVGVTVSPSKVEQFARCQLRWFLTGTGADGPPVGSASIGSLIHDIVHVMGDHEAEAYHVELDRRWSELGLPATWDTRRQHANARRMLTRYADYLASAGDWRPLATEVEVRAEVGRATVVGRVDRVETHQGTGAVRVVDLKTGSAKPTKAQVPRHPQLGAYQVATTHGAFGVDVRSGGAALVHIGKAAGTTGRASVQAQDPLEQDDDPTWAARLLHETASAMAGDRFSATPGQHCQTCPVRSSCPARPEGERL